MMLLSTKTYLVLLWGISVLFSMESKSVSIPETSSISSTAEPNKTTKQLTSAHVLHSETETQPTVVSVAATAETTVSATASEVQPSHNTTISETAKPTEQQQPPATFTDMTAPATAPAKTPATAPATAPATVPATTPPTAPATTPATSPATGPAATSATVSETSSVTAAVSSLMSTSITDVTPKLYSTTSSDNSTQAIQDLSSPSAFSTTATTTNTTSEASHVFDPDNTSSPVTINETSTAGTEILSMSQPVSATRSLISTSHFPDTASPSSTTESPTSSTSTDSASSTTAVSTSLAGILIAPVPKRLPIPTTKSTPATTTAPREVSKSQSCSIHGVVKHCLIAIASLAVLATIFMVTTIVLCTKLSARKYKVKKPQETEMMCISALLPERTYTYTRQRNPVTNGVLVMHNNRDSDDDGDDNLTLSSFLPENDRFV